MELFGILPALIAFAAVKFAGYYGAGLVLKKLQPLVTSSPVNIAAYRLALGVLIGPLLTLGMVTVAAGVFAHGDSMIGGYVFLYFVRVFVWALVVHHFVDNLDFSKLQLWKLSALGALWSCVLDVPGVALAAVSPARVPIC